MRGERKRDCPPNLFFQQPWWEYNHLMSDYQTRLSYILSQGKRIVDVLVIHPIESAFIAFSPVNKSKCNKLDGEFNSVLNILMENHYDFDLGNEGIIKDYGRVQGNILSVGESTYKVVIIPPLINIRDTTLELLKNFISNGGIVIVVKNLPTLVNGSVDTNQIKVKLKGIKYAAFHMLDRTLNNIISPNVKIVLESGEVAKKVFYHQRSVDNRFIYFFCNNDKEVGYDTIIYLKGEGRIKVFNPLNGEICNYPSSIRQGYTIIHNTFSPCGSLLIVKGPSDISEENVNDQKKLVQSIALNEPWKLSALDENAVTIDYCRYSLNGGQASDLLPCLKAYENLKKEKKAFMIHYTFSVDGWDGKDGQLVIETPDRFKIKVNGKTVKYSKEFGYWKDISFKRIPISNWIQNGENAIELSADWDDKIEIEAVYIIGNFKVVTEDQRNFTIVRAEDLKLSENLVFDGFPIYVGKVDISSSFELKSDNPGRCVVNFDKMEATVSEIWINENIAGQILWKPYEIDITPYIKKGTNTIRIRLVNTLHNLLGPHHNARGEVVMPWVVPESFRDYDNWTDNYFFCPFGVSGITINIFK